MDDHTILAQSSSSVISSPSDLERNVKKEKTSWLYFIKLMTVEPTMFLYMMAFMLTSVVEQAFFIHKACKTDLGFSEEICSNLSVYKEKNKEVQVVVSTFHQYNDIASHLIPILLALFVGAWSDHRGRKILLLLGLVGKLWYSVWIIINSLQDKWPLREIIWTASFPSGLTGADLSIFAAAFAYVSDITTSENRTKRITILDVTYLASMPVGIALGKFLFSHFDRSYTVMFSINACLLFTALLYSFFRLNWTTSAHQKPLKLFCLNVSNKLSKLDEDKSKEKQPECLCDFFNKAHLIESIKTVTKSRANHGRIYIIILIISIGLYTFQRDERQMSYLYTNLKFDWDVNSFSDFRIYQSSIYVIGTLFCIPLMGKYFKFSDTTMVMIGTSSHTLARIVFALAQESWYFYLGATFASLGPVVAPVLRSMASKAVSPEEKGRVFAVLSVADTTIPLFSGIVYSQVYNATIHSLPSAIFWVTVTTQVSVFIIALTIHVVSRKKKAEGNVALPSS